MAVASNDSSFEHWIDRLIFDLKKSKRKKNYSFNNFIASMIQIISPSSKTEPSATNGTIFIWIVAILEGLTPCQKGVNVSYLRP